MHQKDVDPRPTGRERRGRWELLSALLVLAGLLALALTGSHADAQGPTSSANLSLTKTDSPDPVRTGKTLTYEITVNNLGPDAAANVVVTDKLPNTVDYVSATTTQGACQAKGRKLTCEVGDLMADATEPYHPSSTAMITIEVKAPKKAGSVTNTAEVTSDADDPTPGNNSDSENTSVETGGGSDATCAGAQATIVGTPGNDELVGTPGRDVIVAGKGNDGIVAGRGRDLICAGPGADLIRSGGGSDKVKAGSERDFVRAGRDDDRVSGGAGNDTLRGQRGDDRLRGGRGADDIGGGPGTDRCKGGAGNDVIRSCEL